MPNLRCVLCGREAKYVKDGMSLCEEHFKAQQVGDKDIDLMKIQIYADKLHTFLTLQASVVFVVLGFFGIFITLYYQSLMELNFYFVNVYNVGMTVNAVLAICAFEIFMRRYHRDFERISRMIGVVQRGEQLPDLDKLNKCNG